MAEREIKIGFPEVKMEALEFFLKENDTTVESKMIPQTEEPAQNEAGNARQGRGQGRRSTRQQTARETVLEQENNGAEQDSETEEQEPEQEQTGGMSMSM